MTSMPAICSAGTRYLSNEEFGGDSRRRIDVRAPEKLKKSSVLTEKRNVCALGTVLYNILTGQRMHSCKVPDTCPGNHSALSDNELREFIHAGALPALPDEVESTESVATIAFRHSMYDALK